MTRPLLIDAYCGAGGASEGYRRAGFDVVGIDLAAQPRYPFPFIRGDALAALERLLGGGILRIDGRPALALADVAAIHASPPCQHASKLKVVWDRAHPDLIDPTRQLLRATGLPHVIENVEGARLIEPITLCGSSFGLRVRRHRLFECSFVVMTPPCAHGQQDHVVGVYGHTGAGANQGRERDRGRTNGVADWRAAMGIDWMTRDEIAQAIPPRYTEHIGTYLQLELAERAAAVAA